MLPLSTTKLAINLVSSLGVSKVVGDIVRNNTTVITPAQKFLVNAGGLVLGSMIVEHALDHVNDTIDQVVEWHRQEKVQDGVAEQVKAYTEPAE